MRVLLTGGSGDLGTLLALDLLKRGDSPLNLDLRSPQAENTGEYRKGSITERGVLAEAMQGVDAVVHIAAWHGIHEFRQTKDADDFWDVNVTGTFNVFEAAHRAGVNKIIYISSTSIEERFGLYGHTKVLGEEIAQTYHERHRMNVLTLRPRAFIPHWNRETYSNFIEWAKWFWGGAVHIEDVKQATLKALDRLKTPVDYAALVIDGAHEYSDEDLANWQGLESFRKYYAPYEALVLRHGLDPALKPSHYDMRETNEILGYQPEYSLLTLLQELEAYGGTGSARPF
jgi:nucleoside-diphosphate-sugar epimerase